MHRHLFKSQQQGATLIVALVFLVVLTAAGITAMRFASVEERMASNSQFRNQTFQLAQSEIRAHLLAFNQNLANRAPLLLAMNQPLSNSLPSNLPVGTKDPQTINARMGAGIDAQANSVRFTTERPCDDGSNVEKFSCLSFEMNVTATTASGANSWQSQGLTFQNNK